MSEATQNTKRPGRRTAVELAEAHRPGWVGLAAVAAELGVAKDRIRALTLAGAVPSEKIGGAILLPSESVERLRLLFDSTTDESAGRPLRREPPPAGWVGFTEAGRRIGWQRDRVRRAAQAGQIRSVEVGGVTLVEEAGLDRLAASRPPAPAVDVPADLTSVVASDPAPVADLEEAYQ